jgi:hypothetical protein
MNFFLIVFGMAVVIMLMVLGGMVFNWMSGH